MAHCATLGLQAMLTEVALTPKPGLVDSANSGAHSDMSFDDFQRSATVIADWLPAFMQAGLTGATLPGETLLARIRVPGFSCERAMLAATAGVNTHKGTIFALGLLCTAIGALSGRSETLTQQRLSQEVARICCGIVERELQHSAQRKTAGQRIYHQYGISGARGEAASGFQTVMTVGLPTLRAFRARGVSEDIALLEVLLRLIHVNHDTNVIARGGIEGLRWIQRRAGELLAAGGMRQRHALRKLTDFDSQCIARRLSPGGSADLLIITWFLSHFPAGMARANGYPASLHY
ncbi:triphosphoribosyl-dephospho-CoA synthase CitG [Entomohabitans teleogrylli]|uniref:triphosphoribosyl-dephospho-CoA synthase CitG n=1 Tax=Entomohabitans teleogrylli TaxID=1384589 RepID=UPI0008FC6475|nr:triphosphoribosyl-dephospho-CoA synthase CitG [Entomohabitans teleogrylli]